MNTKIKSRGELTIVETGCGSFLKMQSSGTAKTDFNAPHRAHFILPVQFNRSLKRWI